MANKGGKKTVRRIANEDDARGRVVTGAQHLVVDGGSDLSEFEFGMIIASHAFNRWVVRCMSAAGLEDASPLDVFVLNIVFHRNRPKRVADICLALNVEDTHLVSYSLRKLARLGLVQSERRGNETFHSATEDGAQMCNNYREVRKQCLLSPVAMLPDFGGDLGKLAMLLRAFSGIYDQAARAATSL